MEARALTHSESPIQNPQSAIQNPAAAYCDVDGTLAATTIVTPLMWFKRRQLPAPLYGLWAATLCVRGPWWLVLDRFNRGASNRAIYACYGGMSAEKLRALQNECYAECIQPRLFPKALEIEKQLIK